MVETEESRLRRFKADTEGKNGKMVGSKWEELLLLLA
jgi:hypothetical protein